MIIGLSLAVLALYKAIAKPFDGQLDSRILLNLFSGQLKSYRGQYILKYFISLTRDNNDAKAK